LQISKQLMKSMENVSVMPFLSFCRLFVCFLNLLVFRVIIAF
jgi:hypothetical protein